MSYRYRRSNYNYRSPSRANVAPVLASRHFRSSMEYFNWARPDLDKLPRSAYFGERVREAVEGAELLLTGDNTHVDEAKKLLANFQESVDSVHYKWEHDLVGAFPDVPAYCAGDPESMWFRQQTTSDQVPLRIWVCITSSASVYEEELRARGVALAAFALALSEKRPVYVTPWVQRGEYEGHGSVISWDIQTSPMILSELLPCLSDPKITRHLGLPVTSKLNPLLTTPNPPWHPDDSNEAKMRTHLGCADEDIYIPGLKGYDPIRRDPVAWIKVQLAKYGQSND